MTCPLLRTDKLLDFLAVYDPTKLLGRGCEHWFLHTMGPDLEGRVAIVDEVSCSNPWSFTKGGREIDPLQSSADRRAAWQTLSKELGILGVERGLIEFGRVPRASVHHRLARVRTSVEDATVNGMLRCWIVVKRFLRKTGRFTA